MYGKALLKLIIAITNLIDSKSANLDIDTELAKNRLADIISHQSKSPNMDNDNNWPDDFEEDWE